MAIVLRTKERTVTETTYISRLPLWMQLAVDGQKINAIKELRALGGSHWDDEQRLSVANVTLKAAKDIVEDFTDLLSVVEE